MFAVSKIATLDSFMGGTNETHVKLGALKWNAKNVRQMQKKEQRKRIDEAKREWFFLLWIIYIYHLILKLAEIKCSIVTSALFLWQKGFIEKMRKNDLISKLKIWIYSIFIFNGIKSRSKLLLFVVCSGFAIFLLILLGKITHFFVRKRDYMTMQIEKYIPINLFTWCNEYIFFVIPSSSSGHRHVICI